AVLSLSFTHQTESSNVIPERQQAQIADVLEDDAQVMSNSQLDEVLPLQPKAVQEEILRINDHARDRSLQFALLVPILAGRLGLGNGIRMRRLPDPKPSEAAEGLALG